MCIRGVWEPQAEVLFDIHIIDTDTPSPIVLQSVLSSAEEEKKRKYPCFPLVGISSFMASCS